MNVLPLLPLFALCAVFAVGHTWVARRDLRSSPVPQERINRVTFTREEKVAAREWMGR